MGHILTIILPVMFLILGTAYADQYEEFINSQEVSKRIIKISWIIIQEIHSLSILFLLLAPLAHSPLFFSSLNRAGP